MRSRKRTTVINLCFQGYGIAMAFVSGVVLVPLYLRHIPADLYGAWQASGNVLTWMTLLDPGLSGVIQQRVASAYGQRDAAAVSGWIASGVWVTVGISLLIMVAGLASSFFLSSWMRLPAGVDRAALAGAFRWSAVGSALMILSFSVTAANQGLQSSLGTGSISAVALLLRFVLVVVLVRTGFGLLAIAMPSVVMGLALLAGNVIYLRTRLRMEQIRISWVPTRLRALATLLSFTSLGKAASMLVNNVDLFLVARYLGPDSVNTLRFTRTAPEMSRMLVDRPAAAVQPSFAHLLGAGGVGRGWELAVRVLRMTIWLLALLAGGFVAFNHDFLRLWVGERFYAGTTVNLLLIASFVVSAGASVLASLSFAAGNIRGTSLAGAAQALLYLPLVWVGARSFGIGGAVAAGLLSVAVTQGWYQPGAFVRIYGLTRPDRLRLLKTVAQTAAAALLPALAFGRAHPGTWMLFGAWTAAFAGSYVVLLSLFSAEARTEARHGWDWVQTRYVRSEATSRADS